MHENDWDPIREKHYGQRSCAPHKQAGHMTAPTNAAETSKKVLPIRRRPHMTQSGRLSSAKVLRVVGNPLYPFG
jgi:ribosomal protein S5